MGAGAQAKRLARPGPAIYALLQLMVLATIGVWYLFSPTGSCGRGSLPRLLVGGFWQSRPAFPIKGSVHPLGGSQRYTQAVGLQIAELCRGNQAEELASRFLELSAATPNFTACPSKHWLTKLQEVSPGGGKVFVDVGCRQGYTSAALFGLWAPELEFTPKAIRKVAPATPCGACGECEQEAVLGAALQAKGSGLQVLCVEPHPLRYSALVELREHFFTGSVPGMRWRLMQSGVGSGSSGASVALCPMDGGSCSLAPPADAGGNLEADVVPVVTVDELLAMHQLQHADLLKIDAEGFELPALGGAVASIAAGRVGVLTFSYGGHQEWQNGKLLDAVARLDELGYSCYLAGKQTSEGSLARLTGCWRPSYETHTPSTIVCVPRSHALYPHVERMSLRYGLYREVYYEQDAGPGELGEQPEEAMGPVDRLLGGETRDELRPAEVLPQDHGDLLLTEAQQWELNTKRKKKEEEAAQAVWAAFAAATLAKAAKALATTGQMPVTGNATEWSAAPDGFVFQDPQSRCLLHPNGTAEPPPGWRKDTALPFLFDIDSMPTRDTVCPHCPAVEKPPICCGVCIFESRLCEQYYPRQNKSEAVAQQLLDSGYQLRAFTPCELFQRIRGRTLWFVGDSQTWHFFYSAECFLRSFAPSLRRTAPLSWALSQKLVTVTWPVKVPPICLELVLGTRVCAVRVDTVTAFMGTVMPTLHKNTPNFKSGIMIYNTGLHYGTPGMDGKPANASQLYSELSRLVKFKRQYGAEMPKMVWMDIPHFSGPDGSYSGGEKPFTCKPLAAWGKGDPVVGGGGRRNLPLAPLVPHFADAHLRTWNASIPFWDSHKPGECTHWCSPSAYHMWLYLLNDVMRDSGLGNAVAAPARPSMAAAAAVGGGGQGGGSSSSKGGG